MKLLNYQTAIFIIIFLATFLRFYNLPNSFVFAGDEEHQVILAQSLIKHLHIIWIGVNAAHLGFYLGPFWAYFTAFWLMVSKGNPQITGYISSTLGVLTTFLIIFVGKNLFSKRTGLLAGILYATLPLMVFYDQKYWNPTLIPALSLLLLFSLHKLKGNPKMLILFSISAGLIFHTHLSLVPIILIAFFWIILKKIYSPKKVIFLSISLFLLIISPLIAFDYFHKGSNITTPLRFQEISSSPENRINPTHHAIALFQTLGRIWYIKPVSNNSDEVISSCAYSSRTDTLPVLKDISTRFNPPFWLSLISLILLLLFFINKSTWQKDESILLSSFLLSITISFLFFPGGAFEYYLLGIFPLILFIPGILASYYKQSFSSNKKISRLIIFSTFTISILGIFTILTNNPTFGFEIKNSLVKQVIAKIGNEPFELKQTGLCHFYEAWRYLFALNGKKPERSDSDLGLGWLYPEEITQKKVKYMVIMSESRVLVNFDIRGAMIINSGGFTAYIFKDKI